MQNPTHSQIALSQVSFTYPDGKGVLHRVSCDIQRGEKVALIGPNGAGKSTLINLLNGTALASEGQIHIDGIPVVKSNLAKIRKKIGVVFQDPDDQLFCPTVYDDVAFGPLNLGLDKTQIQQRVQEALQIVGLEGYEQRAPFHLSFGEKKRLALATVLSYQPDILVFDEPSTNMDPLNRRRLIDWLKKCDKTIILCTHDLDIALEICDRCLLLAQGELVATGQANDILYNRTLLEKYHLELPLALMTHEMLQNILQSVAMDPEHRDIIGKFLHTHRHVHDPDQSVHLHFHAHPHDHAHVGEKVNADHIHYLGPFKPHSHGNHKNFADLIPHSHEEGHGHDHPHSHDLPPSGKKP